MSNLTLGHVACLGIVLEDGHGLREEEIVKAVYDALHDLINGDPHAIDLPQGARVYVI